MSLRSVRQELMDRSELVGLDFCREYSRAADVWLGSLLESATGGDAYQLALIAVGGYGRGELCPGSDLDVAFVHHPRKRKVKPIADAIWYPIWDEGVHLDHSVRTPKQVLEMARDDLKVMLGFLDARLVAGDARLAEEVIARAKELWRGSGGRMLPALQESVALRHASRGDVAFLLEPDVKEDRGGLRDLHAIHSVASLVPSVPDPSANPKLVRANEVLLAVRVELHRRSGRDSNVLLLQEQDPVAKALGYPDADALMADVAAAGRAISWAVDDCLRRIEDPPGTRPGRTPEVRAVERGIVIADGEVGLAPDAEVTTDCTLPFRCAAVAAESGVPISHRCLDDLSEGTPPPPDPWPDSLLQSLVRLLGTGRAAIREIEALDSRGILVRLLPEWESVRNLPQRNAFHRFTVDRHLCETSAAACTYIREVSRPDLLLVGALLHDIGKGSPGDHTVEGMRVVREVATRMGFDDSDVDVLVRLVEHHLLLPDTAAKRDLDDPATIEAAAAKAGDPDFLLLLSALTQADSLATGPAASSPWKMRMVQELVARTLNRMAGLPHEAGDPFGKGDPALGELVSAALSTGRPVLRHEPLPDGDGWELHVAAPDRPGLLASVAGVLALHNLSVRSAQVGMPAPGIAAERFSVASMYDRTPRWDRVEDDLAHAVTGSLDLDERLAAKIADYEGNRRPGAARPAEPRVIVDNDASERATVVEVRAPDGIGVLYLITSALQDCGMDIVTAKVHTLGHEVVDTFYVRRMADGVAGKVTHPDDLRLMEEHLLARLSEA